MKRILALGLWAGLLVALTSCASSEGGPRGGGGGDGGLDGGDAGATCETDEDCPDDGVFCNGELVCSDGRCVSDAIPTCNDGIGCTQDECLAATDECQNTPVDSACPEGLICDVTSGCSEAPACEFDDDCSGDGVFCNGDEVCVDAACVAPGSRDCDDDDSCTIDECVESEAMCGNTLADYLTDPDHCGPTGEDDCVVCPDPPATAEHVVRACVGGSCEVLCEEGFFDLDGDPDNGCEYECTPETGIDVPDDGFTDSDCDGLDGDRERAVFLSSTGDDGDDGLTAATAVRTMARALTIAGSMSDRDQILVAVSTYGTSTPLELPDGNGMYGGYASDFSSRSDAHAALVSSAGTALTITSHTMPSVVDRVDLTTEDQTTPSAATRTLVVSDSGDNFRIRYSIVTAGRGGAGGAGSNGGTGSNGTAGVNGSGSSGGSGGSIGGGAGANGRRRATGPAGSPGNSNGSPCGGAGGSGSGSGGLGCADGDPAAGGNGGSGCNGLAGSSGSGGDGLGTLSGLAWSPTNSGVTGANGGTGGGGGGGGAGGGEDCTALGSCIYCGTGRGGGGGGGGGQGGGGGEGGGGGGASIAIVLDQSVLELDTVTVRTVGGGAGGAGGAGGTGGSGGPGGLGGSSSSSTDGPGGNGGDGGNGGAGGCGGGGGGGPSIGVWGTGSGAQLRHVGAVTYDVSGGGAGGGSCPGGSVGASGVQSDRRSITLL